MTDAVLGLVMKYGPSVLEHGPAILSRLEKLVAGGRHPAGISARGLVTRVEELRIVQRDNARRAREALGRMAAGAAKKKPKKKRRRSRAT